MKGTIKTEPMPALRQQIRVINGQVISYTPDKARAGMTVIQEQLAKYNFEPFAEHIPLKLTITFYRTQSHWNKTRIRDSSPVRRPDLSNFLKLFEDAANGLLFYDDSQIVKTVASKKWTDKKKGYITFELEEVK